MVSGECPVAYRLASKFAPVSEDALLAFMGHLEGKLSRSSINSCLQALNSIHKKGLNLPGIITSEAWYMLEALKQSEARKRKTTKQATPLSYWRSQGSDKVTQYYKLSS